MKTRELFQDVPLYLEPYFRQAVYPWELLPKIKEIVRHFLDTGLEGYTEYAPDVLIGENVKIASTATIEPPAVIGSGTELRPGAFLRGNVIVGQNCVIGNSSELKNCILLDKVQAPHYNYIGDSVLGVHAHMGAGAICSNLKADGKAVVIHGGTDLQTGLRKVGSFLGDGADIGCGCVLNPGTIVGAHTSVYPLNALRGVFPADSIVKSNDTIVKRK